MKDLIDTLELAGRLVVDFQVGRGELVRHVLAAGASVVGYEQDESLVGDFKHVNLTLRFGDVHEMDWTWLRYPKRLAIISTPSYAVLPLIASLIEEHDIKDFVLLMASSKKKFFPPSSEEIRFKPEDFAPPELDKKIVVRSEHFKKRKR